MANGAERGFELGGKACRKLFSVLVKVSADLCGDREARRNRQPKPCHLGETGALAAEEVSQTAFVVGLALTESANPFCHHEPFGGEDRWERFLPRCDQTGRFANPRRKRLISKRLLSLSIARAAYSS